ncbi:phage tail assembly protein [Xanthobacter autotrophicus]|uniref:phage tail assembly protein n=1 Tax=Xanthobacter autotrophicus TaxID=280 RepID=UPI00372644E1
MENLPPPIDTAPAFTPVAPPPGSPDATRRVGAPVTAPEAPAPQARPAAAALEFESGRTREVPLSFPATWEGRRIGVVTVRRLITAEVAALVPDGKVPDVFEVYAVMTGLPAPVLRGLDGDDGQAVAEAAFDFLPRLLRAAYSG